MSMELLKLAEKFEHKMAQSVKEKAPSEKKLELAPTDTLMVDEDSLDIIHEAQYVSNAIAALSRELGIPNGGQGITQQRAETFKQRMKKLLPGLLAVLNQLNNNLNTPTDTAYLPTSI